jgi:hypothetical protein
LFCFLLISKQNTVSAFGELGSTTICSQLFSEDLVGSSAAAVVVLRTVIVNDNKTLELVQSFGREVPAKAIRVFWSVAEGLVKQLPPCEDKKHS